MTERVTNQTTSDWAGFRFDIIDQNPIAADGSVHPKKAHFHFKAFTASDRLKPPQVPNNNGTYTGTATQPQIVGKNGDTWNASILKMHDRLDPDPANPGQFLRMDFKLVETPLPVPEPGTLGMIAAPLFIGILGWRRLRQHPRSPGADS